MSSAPIALLVAALLVGAGAALGAARWKPSLLGAPALGRPAWDPARLWPLAAVALGAGGWTGFSFWQGTRYAPVDCAMVHRVADALEQTDLSVRLLNRAVGDFTDAVTDAGDRRRRLAWLPFPARPAGDTGKPHAGGP